MLLRAWGPWFVTACAWLITGCGGGVESAPDTAAAAKIAGPTAQDKGAGDGPEIAGDPEPTGSEKPGVVVEIVVETPDPEAAEEPRNPRAIELPVDSRYLALGTPPADPKRYRKWRQKGRIMVGKSHLSDAHLLDGGRLLLAMSRMESTVRVYDRASRKLLGNHAIPGFAQFDRGDLASWPGSGGEPMFLFGKKDGLWLFSANSGEPVAQLDTGEVWQLRWSPDNQILVADLSRIPAQTSRLTFFKRNGPRSLERLGEIECPERIDAWSLTRDNRYMAVIYYPSDTLELIDLRSGEGVFKISIARFGGDVAISPDGRAIAVGGSELLLIDTSNPLRRTTFTDFGNNIGRVRFSPSGDVVVTSSYDGRVRIFDYDLAQPKLKLIKKLAHAGSSNVYELLFTDGGVGLISTSGDKTIRFWGR